MKRQLHEFNFRGFVALADLLFALSAGLLLLNPVKFTTKQNAKPDVKQQIQVIRVEIQTVEKRLDKLERDGRHIQLQAAEVVGSE